MELCTGTNLVKKQSCSNLNIFWNLESHECTCYLYSLDSEMELQGEYCRTHVPHLCAVVLFGAKIWSAENMHLAPFNFQF